MLRICLMTKNPFCKKQTRAIFPPLIISVVVVVVVSVKSIIIYSIANNSKLLHA